MPPIPVFDPADPRIAVYRNLPTWNFTRHSGRFIAEGMHVVLRLLASDYGVESVLTGEAAAARIAPHVPEGTPHFVAPKKLLEEIVGYRFHRGALACGLRRPPPRLEDVLPPPPRPATLVVCPDVLDPENLGGILRAAAAFGVQAVLLGGGCADPYSRRVLRVSMGTVFRLSVIQSLELPELVDRLRQELAVELFATVLDPAAPPLETVRRPPRLALLLGAEGEGLSTDWLTRCSHRVTIPMQLGTDSLNVAMAAGIFLYHFTRLAAAERAGP